jgi:prolyl-tRNA synthetase
VGAEGRAAPPRAGPARPRAGPGRPRAAHTHRAETLADLERLLGEGGFVEALCDGTDETELAIKEKTKATIRVVLEDAEKPLGKCVLTGKPAARRALFAIAY